MAYIWANIVRFRPLSIRCTINYSDRQELLVQILCGEEISLDRFLATAGLNAEAKPKNVAEDLFAAAKAFHVLMEIIMTTLSELKKPNSR